MPRNTVFLLNYNISLASVVNNIYVLHETRRYLFFTPMPTYTGRVQLNTNSFDDTSEQKVKKMKELRAILLKRNNSSFDEGAAKPAIRSSKSLGNLGLRGNESMEIMPKLDNMSQSKTYSGVISTEILNCTRAT